MTVQLGGGHGTDPEAMARPLEILYVGTLPPHEGGSAVSASQLLIGFAKLGHRLQCLSQITTQALESGDAFAGAHPEFAIRRLPIPVTATNTDQPGPEELERRDRAQIDEAFPRMVTARRPDIVFIGRETFVPHVAPLAVRYGLPSILRVAGTRMAGILRGNFPEEYRREFFGWLAAVGRIVVQAPHMASELQAQGFETLTIPNAVDLHRFQPGAADPALRSELAIPDDHLVVLHVSNMKLAKRPLDIVESAPRVLARNPKITFVFVGDGPLRRPAEEACAATGIAGNFRFVRWAHYDDIPRYIQLADIVVMPSEFEHQARTYLETQACGRVLIASDIPGAREVVEDGRNGLLYRAAEIEDLAAKIVLAADDTDLRAAIGDRARQLVAGHELMAISRRYVEAMREVVDAWHAGQSRRPPDGDPLSAHAAGRRRVGHPSGQRTPGAA